MLSNHELKQLAIKEKQNRALQPSMALLCKLGSLIVHFEEARSPGFHKFDLVAIKQLLNDPEVVQWMVAMDAEGFLPKKR